MKTNWKPKRSIFIHSDVTPDALLPEWNNESASAISSLLKNGEIPNSLKESITMISRKERRQNYSVLSSYLLIALENSLAKLVEKIVALQRLLWVLQREGFPPWLVKYINNVMSKRRTKLLLTGYTSDWALTDAGIPQGSHPSPALLLFYISELLESLQQPEKGYMALGFVDDRGENQPLRTVKFWNKRIEIASHRLKVHFAKKRGLCTELQAGIKVGVDIGSKSEMKVLGFIVDSKLRWDPQVAQTVQNGEKIYNLLARIASSVWGSSKKRARPLYSAIVRPAMLYGSQVWSIQRDGQKIEKSVLAKLDKIQNQCLRKITGAYKSSPRAIMEREAAIVRFSFQMQASCFQYGLWNKSKPVTKKTKEHRDNLWKKIGAMEITRSEAEKCEEEIREEERH
ncbi:hypothetical protein Golomagni_02397 [Golovinomyces magnicellulatus]|nr:hypothetical protein Golomagni_02397 [Golovinomyces magnicellulatus]